MNEQGSFFFGVLILNMNGLKWLRNLLPCLEEDRCLNKKVYIIDNGSTDGSVEWVRENHPNVVVLAMPENLGYCMAYNLASRIAFNDGCDWVIWQNNDTLVEPGWLDRFADVATQDPKIGVMGPVFLDWSNDGPNFFMRNRHPDVVPFMLDSDRAPVDCDWVEGSSCAVRKKCFEDVGPLEPDLFIYWEEADFCRRARFRGWRVAIVPGAVARHYGGGDTASGNGSVIPFNALKMHNSYVYKLCDPEREFSRNVLSAFRLWISVCRGALRSQTPLHQLRDEAEVFGRVLRRLRRWRAKWCQDRAGRHPPTVQNGKSITVEMIVRKGIK